MCWCKLIVISLISVIIIILYKYISLQNKKKILKKDDDLKKYREGVIRKFQIQE